MDERDQQRKIRHRVAVLRDFDLGRLPASQRHKRHDRRWKRYEKPLPGHRVQIDVKFIEPLPGARRKRFYQYTAIDDCTRIRVLRIYHASTDTSEPETTITTRRSLPTEMHRVIRSIQSPIRARLMRPGSGREQSPIPEAVQLVITLRRRN